MTSARSPRTLFVLSFTALLALSLLPGAAARRAAADDAVPAAPRCEGSVPGFELRPLPEHSGVHAKGLMCNYTMTSTDGRNLSSGMAITIELDCPSQTQESFKGKTGTRKRYDRSADVTRGEVQRSGTSLLLREDRNGEGYAGPFTVQQKMFVLIDPQTIATIVVLTDVKPPKDENEASNPDVLTFSAEQATGLAQSLAGAHSSLKANLPCAAAPVEEEPEPAPEMSLALKLGLTTASGRDQIPHDETVSFPVTVSAKNKANSDAVAATSFAPLEVELYRDDILIEKGTTDSEGSITFRYTPPQDTPEECKKHRFKAVASKEGVGSAEDALEAEIQRGPCERVVVVVLRDGIEIPRHDPPIVFSPTKDAPVRFRIRASLDPERTPQHFRFRIGGPLARFATIEQAEATETPGEYEVRGTPLANVVLVVAPLSAELATALDAGGIELEVRASPD